MDIDRDKQQLLEEYLDSLQFENKEFQLSDMILCDDSPRPIEYVETDDKTKNTHSGQMKLLLTDEMRIMLGLLYICEKSNRTVDLGTTDTPPWTLQGDSCRGRCGTRTSLR